MKPRTSAAFATPFRVVASASLALSATLALSHDAAHAGGFATARFGGAHGHPTTANPTAIYYNPAGMALGKGTRIFAEGVLAYRSASYTRPEGAIDNVADGEVGTPTDAVDANAGEATLSNLLASPFLGVVSDLGVENLGVGLAFYAPFGGQADWDKNNAYEGSTMYPGAVDGVQRWSTTRGVLRALYFTTGAAYRLPGPKLSIGATFSVVREQTNTIRARTALGTDDLVNGSGGLVEGRALLDVSGTTFAAGLGLLWEPADDLYLGLSYLSQPGFGSSEQTGDLSLKLGSGGTSVSAVRLEQSLPDTVRFGARFLPETNIELRFSADYTRWSVFDKQCVVDANNANTNCTLNDSGGATPETQGVVVNQLRNWQDTFGVGAGGSYWLSEATELAVNLSYDSNAVPDQTIDPAIMDMDKVVALIGTRLKLLDTMLLNLSYTHVFYFQRDVPIRNEDFEAPSSVPDHAGSYSQTIGLLNLGVEYFF